MNHFISKGGIFMYPLLLCSVLLWSIIVERVVFWLHGVKKQNGASYIYRFKKTIETLISIAPFLGLLGTIHGIMVSFDTFQEHDIRFLARGIAEALVTTMTGLIIALVATVFNSWIEVKIENYKKICE